MPNEDSSVGDLFLQAVASFTETNQRAVEAGNNTNTVMVSANVGAVPIEYFSFALDIGQEVTVEIEPEEYANRFTFIDTRVEPNIYQISVILNDGAFIPENAVITFTLTTEGSFTVVPVCRPIGTAADSAVGCGIPYAYRARGGSTVERVQEILLMAMTTLVTSRVGSTPNQLQLEFYNGGASELGELVMNLRQYGPMYEWSLVSTNLEAVSVTNAGGLIFTGSLPRYQKLIVVVQADEDIPNIDSPRYLTYQTGAPATSGELVFTTYESLIGET